MSELTTILLPDDGIPLGTFEVKTPAGNTVSIGAIGTAVNCARVDVKIENGRHWVFGVNNRSAVLVMVLNEVGKRIDANLPNWIEPVIQRTGLNGVEEA